MGKQNIDMNPEPSTEYAHFPLPFGNFIRKLKARGFLIGVDHHVRVRAVLHRFGADATPEDLKRLLCPLFAVNAKQQDTFNRLWDETFKPAPLPDEIAEPEREKPAEPDTPPALETRESVYIFAAVLWIVFILLAGYRFFPPEDIVIAKPDPVIEESTVKPVDRLPNITVRIPVETEPPAVGWYHRYGKSIRWGIVFVLPVIALFYALYQEKTRRPSVQKGRGSPPEYYLPIRIRRRRPPFFDQELFYGLADRMRERVETGIQTLDMSRTIHSTIDNAGFPAFQYRQITRPAEYLCLIDHPVRNDHYSNVMSALMEALIEEDVFAQVYRYTEDPGICFKNPGDPRESIADIQAKYPEHRLILIGRCDALIDPETGRLYEWTQIFQRWRERAVLTPVRPGQWGMREVVLADIFTVLPATLDGFRAMMSCFAGMEASDLGAWAAADTGYPVFDGLHMDVDALEKHLDKTTFEWLCACAVYPELHFNLTLYLGMRICGKISEKRLLRLLDLSWFRKGEIPDDERQILKNRLEPEKLQRIREDIYTILQENPPGKDDPEREMYELNLAVHQWLVARDKRRYLKKIRENEARIVQDHTLIKLVEEGREAGGFLLPEALQKFFFRQGVRVFGLQSRVIVLCALLMAAIAFHLMPKPVDSLTESVKTELVMEFAHAPAGTFTMGSPADEPGRDSDETPHQVTLTKGFYMQTTEVTQGQWKAVMGENPSFFKNCGDDCPVENVSWNDVQTFIERLNRLAKNGGYRLPTEAEWEYACRAGSQTALYSGPIQILGQNNAPALDPIAWYGGNSGVKYKGGYDSSGWLEKQYKSDRSGTHSVGQKKPNEWGLYDMIGNVYEWCYDWYGDYPSGEVKNPIGSEKGSARVARGGSWLNFAGYCRSADRDGYEPDFRDDGLGFRLVVPPRSP